MESPRNYTPRYIELDDVPIDITDSYSVAEKREALFQAESRFELDENGGEEIPNEEITPYHQTAVANLATHHLTRGAVGNDDVTLGDLEDGGDQRESHAQQFKETYEELIDAIAETGPNEQTGVYFGVTGDDDGPVTVNSGPYSRRHDLGEQYPHDARHLVHDSFIDE